ncbi:zinc finger MYND domain-containing protein [Aspergillus alliaceus]|uniref:zinc finger MYND domain-containing protein n=1 Tax=Petromyces alliaceus TaxID=209559 RepID=UPI0012A5204E|nr:uncharacterized protein BDW43DRAFT_282005 [Aspergillus alliaceus]KAB8231621.1 hypothetical protein BDW43DRAFT_282005 [Aspergillus alliaceus]
MELFNLPSGCGICGKKEGLLRCAVCKVMPYCGRDHQTAHHPSHKSACSTIGRRRVSMEEREQALRGIPGDPFDTSVGDFWGLPDTRDYMRARFALVEAMSRINNVESVQARLDHCMDLLQLCRSDNMGVRLVVPAMMLRLNKDQECYDFVTWSVVISEKSDYDWGDTNLPYYDIKNADAFEPVDRFCSEFVDLSHTVAVMLLKIKMLFDLVRLDQSASAFGARVPREILDQIQLSVPQSPVVVANRQIQDCEIRQEETKKLKVQIHTLYTTIGRRNTHFWAALLSPELHLSAKPEYHSAGAVEEMQVVLKLCYDAWAETSGAIGFIKAKMQGKL